MYERHLSMVVIVHHRNNDYSTPSRPGDQLFTLVENIDHNSMLIYIGIPWNYLCSAYTLKNNNKINNSF